MPAQSKLMEIDGNRCVYFEALRKLLLLPKYANKKIAILNIVGPLRSGKSFLLNHILRYLTWLEMGSPADVDWTQLELEDGGFEFCDGDERTTTGIDYWPHLFLVKNAKGEEFVVLVCDTQGFHDGQTSQKACTALFSVATTLASVLVFNINKQLNDVDLTGLSQYLNDSRNAQVEEQSEEKPLQHLKILIRDYSSTTSYGAKAANEYVAGLERDAETSEARDGFDILNRCCSKKSACRLPMPKNSTSGDLQQMGEEFKEHFRTFIQSLVEELEPKMSGGHAMTCLQLEHLLESVERAVPNSEVFHGADILQANIESQLNDVVESTLENFRGKLQAACTGREDFGELSEKHFQEAEAEFAEEATMGVEAHQQAARQKLIEKMNETAKMFALLNEAHAGHQKASEEAEAAKSRSEQLEKKAADSQRMNEELKKKIAEATDPAERARFETEQQDHEKTVDQDVIEAEAAKRAHEEHMANVRLQEKQLDIEMEKAKEGGFWKQAGQFVKDVGEGIGSVISAPARGIGKGIKSIFS